MSKYINQGIKQPSGSTENDHYRLICIHKKQFDIFSKYFA
jgi:hypothetical protein